jgi:putative Mn2+ efflux pump MntP
VSEMRQGFAELSGRVDHVEKVTAGVKTTVLGTGIGVVAVLVGILSYGQTWFGLGISNRETIKAIVAEYAEQQHRLPVAPQGR